MPGPSRQPTPDEVKRSKEVALQAFYRMRSESLRDSHTTTAEGTPSAGALSQSEIDARKRKQQQAQSGGGLFSGMADRVINAMQGR